MDCCPRMQLIILVSLLHGELDEIWYASNSLNNLETEVFIWRHLALNRFLQPVDATERNFLDHVQVFLHILQGYFTVLEPGFGRQTDTLSNRSENT